MYMRRQFRVVVDGRELLRGEGRPTTKRLLRLCTRNGHTPTQYSILSTYAFKDGEVRSFAGRICERCGTCLPQADIFDPLCGNFAWAHCGYDAEVAPIPKFIHRQRVEVVTQ